ncbi:hypothetical protein QR680_008507 [Steinernema hermaphroditum]|uniref:Serpentine receptor class gamma n=1 Tax=Steinernema hermaphroditum TaxID=289476 RepID=A0AA39IGV9_9BILA|nr:hypothetical protein QR680_008507 [Steinernema hermaphroditum]
MNTEIIMLVLSLLYGIPSFVLYVVILIQLIRPKHHKRFSNPFFRLCFLIGIVDCIGYLNFYFFVRLPTYAFLSFVYTSPLFNSSPLTTAMYFLIYFCSNLQLFGNCFLTFNRFTSIVFPLRHHQIWRYCFPASIVLTTLSSLVPFWYLTDTAVWYIPLYNDDPSLGLGMNPDKAKYPQFSNSFNTFVSYFVACGLSLPLNIISALFLLCRTSPSGTMFRKHKAEVNLFLVALLNFIIQTITGVHQVLIYMYKENRAFVLALYTLTPWLSDFKYLSPPWVLLVVSTAVRESVTQMFPKRMPSLPSYSTASPLFTRG